MSLSWPAEESLRARVSAGVDLERFPDDCLEAVASELHADRAIVFLGHASGTASPLCGRDAKRALAPEALEEVSRTLVERCIRDGAPVRWDPAMTGDDAQSATELRLLAAAAVPIGEPARGALYVDFRRPLHTGGAARTDVLVAAAKLLAASLPAREFRPSGAPSARVAPAPPDLQALLSLPGLYAMAPEIEMAVNNPSPVLVLGETGSGKTLLASAIARRLERKNIVRAMLGTADDLNTITSELFGHTRGAFSGASGPRRGLVEHADGGVLVFDEVLNLPLAAQQLLLDFTQFGEYRPLGYDGHAPRRADVRIIAVTNGDIEAAVREKRFREDLYHRLAGTVLRVPSLRERRGDIPGLAAILLPQICPGERWRLSLSARRALVSERLSWPGNVRQFEGALRRAVERARQSPGPAAQVITDAHLDPEVKASVTPVGVDGLSPLSDADFKARWDTLRARRESLRMEEDALILEALEAKGNSKKDVADLLGFESYTTLTSRVQRIKRERSRGDAG